MTDPTDPKDFSRDYSRYATLGLQFGFTVLLFVALGYYLDQKLGTLPLLLILGFLLGAGGAFWHLYRAIYPAQKKKDSETKNK